MEDVKIIEGRWKASLSSMKKGDVLGFPLKSYSSIMPIKSRLQLEMCTEEAEWEPIGEKDRKNGVFYLKRTK